MSCKFICTCQYWTPDAYQDASYSQPITSPDPVELPPLSFRSKRNKKSKKAKKAKSAAALDGEGSAPEAAEPGGWDETTSVNSTPSETSAAPAGIHPSRLRMLGGAPKADPVPAGPSHDYGQPQSRRVRGTNASAGGGNGWGNKRRTPSAPASGGVTHSPNAGSFAYRQPDARPAPPSDSGSAGGTAGTHPDRLRMLGGGPAANSPPTGFGGESRDNPAHM